MDDRKGEKAVQGVALMTDTTVRLTIAQMNLGQADLALLEELGIDTSKIVDRQLIEELGENIGFLTEDGANGLTQAAFCFTIDRPQDRRSRGPKRHKHGPAPVLQD